MTRLSASIAGGLVASLVMDLAQGGFTELFERGRDPGVFDEEVEAIAGVVRVIRRVAPVLVPETRSETVGHILHYTFGAGFAVVYGIARERDRRISQFAGATFGGALWLISDRILIPSTKLGRPWSRYSRSERANALVSHLAYAMSLEFFLRRAGV